MSVLPIGRRLEQVIPDLDELLLDPARYLGAGGLSVVELRREEAPGANGAEVKCRQLVFSPDGRVVLAGRYEVVAKEVGELLLQLGSRLGRQLPAGQPPPEAYHLHEIDRAG